MNEITDFLNIERFNFSFVNVNPEHKYNKKITFEYNKPDYASIIGSFEKKIYEKFKKK